MASNNSNDTGQRPHLLPPIDNTEAILYTILLEMRHTNALLTSLQAKALPLPNQEAVKALPNQSKRR